MGYVNVLNSDDVERGYAGELGGVFSLTPTEGLKWSTADNVVSRSSSFANLSGVVGDSNSGLVQAVNALDGGLDSIGGRVSSIEE